MKALNVVVVLTCTTIFSGLLHSAGVPGNVVGFTALMLLVACYLAYQYGTECAAAKRRQWGVAKIEELIDQRDTAWFELREIRRAIDANPEEATIDEVRAMVARLHDLEAREQEA